MSTQPSQITREVDGQTVDDRRTEVVGVAIWVVRRWSDRVHADVPEDVRRLLDDLADAVTSYESAYESWAKANLDQR
jgi:hypothetical protein